MLNLQAHIENVVQLWRDRASCSAPGCRGRRMWERAYDGNGSIQMHGRRFCFPKCFEQELQRQLAAIRVPARQPSRTPHRVPLGLLMLSRGELSREQLRCALELQKNDVSLRIGQRIVALGYAHERQVTAALGAQWSCPVLKDLPAEIPDCSIPFRLLHRFQMAPVHFNAGTQVLHMAFAADIEYRVLLALEQMLDCKAEPCIADAAAVARSLERQEERRLGADQSFENVSSADEIIRITSSYATKFCADEARIAGCGEYIWIRVLGGKDSANLIFRARESAPRRLSGGSAPAYLL